MGHRDSARADAVGKMAPVGLLGHAIASDLLPFARNAVSVKQGKQSANKLPLCF